MIIQVAVVEQWVGKDKSTFTLLALAPQADPETLYPLLQRLLLLLLPPPAYTTGSAAMFADVAGVLADAAGNLIKQLLLFTRFTYHLAATCCSIRLATYCYTTTCDVPAYCDMRLCYYTYTGAGFAAMS